MTACGRTQPNSLAIAKESIAGQQAFAFHPQRTKEVDLLAR